MLRINRLSVVLLVGTSLLNIAIMREFIYAQNYEISPFGFHPASIGKPGYPNNGFVDAKNIGVRWHRPQIYAFWFIVQPDTSDSSLYFGKYDTLYGMVPIGINILANIAPQGHIDEGYCLPGSYLPVDSAKYVRFVKATVERYDGDSIYDMPGLVNPIKYWQVGNEPFAIYPTDFAELQQITYQAIKDACPDCQVLNGGPCQPIVPSGFMVNIEEYLDWFSTFYEPILEKLNGECIDIFDFHWYGNATGDYRYCGEVFDSLRAIMAKHNFGDIPFWITEMGSYSGNPVEPQFPYQTEASQAGDYLKRFIFSLSIGVKKIFPAFGLMEASTNHNDGYFAHTGLIYDGQDSGDLGLGVKKMGYFTYKLMTQKLECSDWDSVETINTGTDFVYLYSFLKDTLKVYVAWYDYFSDSGYSTGDTVQFVLHDIDKEQVVVTNAVPYDTVFSAFTVDTLAVIGDSVTICLGEDPVFIEELFSPSVEENVFIARENVCLFRNYPTLFTLTTNIKYSIAKPSHVELKIYNLSGRLVRRWIYKECKAGNYEVKWDGRDDNEKLMPSGIYFIKLRAGDKFSQTKKLLLLRLRP